MSVIYPGYRLLSEPEKDSVWQNCRIVPDTNVLLNLYEHPAAMRKDLVKVLEKVKDSLWFPHQVTVEFEKNRKSVIDRARERVKDERKSLAQYPKRLKDVLDTQLHFGAHTSIDAEELFKRFSESVDALVGGLEGLSTGAPLTDAPDDISDFLGRLFDGRTGPPPPDQAWLDDTHTEGDLRYSEDRPPGKEDRKKKKDLPPYEWNGLKIQRQYGDYILWKQLLQEAKGNPNFKYTVLVTSDAKPDWVHTSVTGGQTIKMARVELVEEINREAGVEVFLLIDVESLLREAKARLGVDVTEESIEQAQGVGDSYMGTGYSLEWIDRSFRNWADENGYPSDDLEPVSDKMKIFGVGVQRPLPDVTFIPEAIGYIVVPRFEDTAGLLMTLSKEVDRLHRGDSSTVGGCNAIKVAIIPLLRTGFDLDSLLQMVRGGWVPMPANVVLIPCWVNQGSGNDSTVRPMLSGIA